MNLGRASPLFSRVSGDLQQYETWKLRICSEIVFPGCFRILLRILLRKCLTVLLYLPGFRGISNRTKHPGNSEFALRLCFRGVSGFVPDFTPEMLNRTRGTSKRPSQSPSQSAIFFSELRVLLPLILRRHIWVRVKGVAAIVAQ